MTLTPDTLEQLAALCRQATPGPWAVRTAPDTNNKHAVCDHFFEFVARTDLSSRHSDDACEANAALIAAARNALPALVEIAQAAVRWADETRDGGGTTQAEIKAYDDLYAAIDRARKDQS